MSELTVAELLDRFHAINGAISTTPSLRAERYFPGFNEGLMPFVFPHMTGFSHTPAQDLGMEFPQVSFQVEVIECVGAVMQGFVTESVSKIAEAHLESVKEAYLKRSRLEITGGDPLDGLGEPVNFQGARTQLVNGFYLVRYSFIVVTHPQLSLL